MMELEELDIPEKTFFKIGEVAKLLDLEPYVLRYWESEFEMLDPDKTDSGQRSYRREDIELICQIRGLLYDEMFTIAGARRQLELEVEGKSNLVAAEAEPSQPHPPQTDLWEQRTASQALQIEDLQAQLAEARAEAAKVAQLQAQLADADAHLSEALAFKIDAEELDELREQLNEFDAQNAQLEDELARANQTIASLRSQSTRAASASIDPAILDGLRRQVQNLANLALRPD